MSETTKSDKIRQLSQEQLNAIEHLLQGKSDRAVAEAVGVSRQTICGWRNNDVLFIAELNRQRMELWGEARQRLKSLANRALDVVEQQLDSGDPKVSLAAARYILQGTRLLGDSELPESGPTTPEDVLMPRLRRDARKELEPTQPRVNPFDSYADEKFEKKVDALAERKLKEAMIEAGLS